MYFRGEPVRDMLKNTVDAVTESNYGIQAGIAAIGLGFLAMTGVVEIAHRATRFDGLEIIRDGWLWTGLGSIAIGAAATVGTYLYKRFTE